MTVADNKKLEANINNWEKKLLDLGKKNNLINYKVTKESTIEFETPSISNFWDLFVEDETVAKFPFFC